MMGASAQPDWRPVPGFEGRYEVSRSGAVRSLCFSEPRLVRPYTDKDGYPVVACWRRPHRRAFAVHRLVAEVFKPKGKNALHCEVAHLDGNRANPRAENLKWVSKVENHFHMRAHGTHLAGSKHGSAKLTDEQVAEIRKSPSGSPRAEIAARFGVSKYAITEIRAGRSWKR